MNEKRKCLGCGEVKPHSQFPLDYRTMNPRSKCKFCCYRYAHSKREKHNTDDLMRREDSRSKKCVDCGKIKRLAEFHINRVRKDGFEIYCIICSRIRRGLKPLKERPRAFYRRTNVFRSETSKRCRECKKILTYNMFYNLGSSKDGKQGICKCCSFKKDKAYRETPRGRRMLRVNIRRWKNSREVGSPIWWKLRFGYGKKKRYPGAMWKVVMDLYNESKACVYCGIGLCPADMVPDHKIPISRGGSMSDADNIAVSCNPCNRLKSNMTDIEFKEFRVQYARRMLSFCTPTPKLITTAEVKAAT